MKTWLTVAEGAEYSGVSRDTIYTACERGELRHARVGGRRAIRLKPAWIDAWLVQHARGAEGRPERGAPRENQKAIAWQRRGGATPWACISPVRRKFAAA